MRGGPDQGLQVLGELHPALEARSSGARGGAEREGGVLEGGGLTDGDMMAAGAEAKEGPRPGPGRAEWLRGRKGLSENKGRPYTRPARGVREGGDLHEKKSTGPINSLLLLLLPMKGGWDPTSPRL